MPVKWHLAPVVFSRFSDSHRQVTSHKNGLYDSRKIFFRDPSPFATLYSMRLQVVLFTIFCTNIRAFCAFRFFSLSAIIAAT